ncbi:MAG TPA: cobalamin-binding protein [Polyangiales bacterium]|nr:cobalamin-binding protein [Polyangiales bacterium]
MDRFPKRIVCLTEETTEVLYLLGAEDRIVGISGFTQRPARARHEKPIVSAFTTADIAKIEAQSPDLVLAFSDLQADLVRELIARGHSVVTWNQRSLDEILSMVAMLGGLIGKAREAEELADGLAQEIEAVRALGAGLPRRPRVYFEEWPDPMISGIRWVSELIEVAGGEDVFAELRSKGLARDRIVTPEQVIARDPELIVGSWCGRMLKPERIIARPGFSELRAVKTRRIFEIKSTLILQPGPASLTDGLRELHALIAKVANSPA